MTVDTLAQLLIRRGNLTHREWEEAKRDAMTKDDTLTSYWLSFYGTTSLDTFELHWPWWISGYRGEDDAPTVVAAVRAESEETAKDIVRRSYDDPPSSLEWRFCEERPDDWSPYESDRFPRGDWMPDWPPANLVGPRP